MSNIVKNTKSETIRVLLLEDNVVEARLFQEILKDIRTTDFRIIHVDRLQKALERLSQEEIDVILLDLSLPDTQGLETIERTLTAAPHVPIVVLTGLDDEIIAANALKAGAQDYLVKGQADANVLARAMRYAITQSKTEQALRKSLRRFELLTGISGNLLMTPDPQKLVETLCRRVREPAMIAVSLPSEMTLPLRGIRRLRKFVPA